MSASGATSVCSWRQLLTGGCRHWNIGFHVKFHTRLTSRHTEVTYSDGEVSEGHCVQLPFDSTWWVVATVKILASPLFVACAQTRCGGRCSQLGSSGKRAHVYKLVFIGVESMEFAILAKESLVMGGQHSAARPSVADRTHQSDRFRWRLTFQRKPDL